MTAGIAGCISVAAEKPTTCAADTTLWRDRNVCSIYLFIYY